MGEESYPNIDFIFRYLHLKLLLYRPTFSVYCSATMSPSDQAQPGSWSILYRQNAALRCVQAACDLIHSLSKATTEDATGAWWYGVFCSYHSSLHRYHIATANITLRFNQCWHHSCSYRIKWRGLQRYNSNATGRFVE